jgi:sterol desaturase/sphingolipid hydroxylase (fatty acid hydroxylase superfamily)
VRFDIVANVNGIALMMMVGAALILAELIVNGRTWPKVHGWWGRAILLNLVQAGSAYLAIRLWDPWMSGFRPWSADRLGVIGGAVLGYLLITFIYYWWHRWRHEVSFLWRWIHQVHHSPQRIEIITSFYKHPMEIVFNGILSSAIVYWLVGVGPEAAGLAILATGFAEYFYHWNVKTPHWLGYIIQRPESHCVHHQANLHSYNYGDLPLWDWLFGTLRNPRDWDDRCGFGEDEKQLIPMLLGRDISTPQPESKA